MITLVFQSFDATTQHLTSTAEIVLGFDSPNVNYVPMCDFSRGYALQPREKKQKTVVIELLRLVSGHGVNSSQPPEKPFPKGCRNTLYFLMMAAVVVLMMLKIVSVQPNINSLNGNKLSLKRWISDTKGLLAVKAGQR